MRKQGAAVLLLFAGFVLALLAGLCLARLLAASLNDFIRYTGTTLEILAIFAVTAALRQTILRSFERPGSVVLTPASAEMHITGRDVTLWQGAALGATVEARLQILEENLRRQVHDLRHGLGRLDDRADQLKRDVDSERDERKAADESTWRHFEKSTISGLELRLELVGVAWLVLGVLLAGFSNEIGALCARLGLTSSIDVAL